MPVRENALQHLLGDLLALPETIGLFASNSQFLFLFREPPDLGASRKTREEEEACDRNRKRYTTIDNK
jgi:hypothetical protein